MVVESLRLLAGSAGILEAIKYHVDTSRTSNLRRVLGSAGGAPLLAGCLANGRTASFIQFPPAKTALRNLDSAFTIEIDEVITTQDKSQDVPT